MNSHSYTTVLHALVDLVQAVEKQGMVGPATPAYKAALEVIREHVAPGGDRSFATSSRMTEDEKIAGHHAYNADLSKPAKGGT